MSDLLSEWEAEAVQIKDLIPEVEHPNSDRILFLIKAYRKQREVIQKKDRIFEVMVGETKYRDSWSEERKLVQAESVIKSASNLAEQGIALTKELDDLELGASK